MQAKTNQHSRQQKKYNNAVKLLDNVYYTKNLLEEMNSRRKELLRLAEISGIRYEGGEYKCDESSSEGVRKIALQAQELEETIIRTTNGLLARQKSATNLINRLPDYRSRLVVIKRYIDNKSSEQIAEEMNYSVRHTQRLICSATDQLEEIYAAEMKKRRAAGSGAG